MAMKIVFIAVLCISQGFAFKPFFKQEREPCKHPLPESAEVIPHEFEEAMNEMGNLRETVSAAMMESYFKGTDPNIIIACFDQQRGNFAKLGEEISKKVRKGAQEMAEELGEKYEEYAKQAAEPFGKIADTLKMLPERMWENIKNQDFVKALEVYIESRRIVEENSRILAKITEEFTAELPETAKKAEKLAREIREDAKKGCKAIGDAFRKCVEEGGPKLQFEEPELPAEEAQ